MHKPEEEEEAQRTPVEAEVPRIPEEASCRREAEGEEAEAEPSCSSHRIHNHRRALGEAAEVACTT